MSLIPVVLMISGVILVFHSNSEAQQPMVNYSNPLTGVIFTYPKDWTPGIYFGSEEQFCKKIEMHCVTTLNAPTNVNNYASFNLIAERGPEFQANCNCKNLTEWVRTSYKLHESQDKNFFFLNDSRIKIADNVSAWQIEYRDEFVSPLRHLEILTVHNGIFYTIDYQADYSSYEKFLPHIQNIINSIRFIPIEKHELPRVPSFLK